MIVYNFLSIDLTSLKFDVIFFLLIILPESLLILLTLSKNQILNLLPFLYWLSISYIIDGCSYLYYFFSSIYFECNSFFVLKLRVESQITDLKSFYICNLCYFPLIIAQHATDFHILCFYFNSDHVTFLLVTVLDPWIYLCMCFKFLKYLEIFQIYLLFAFILILIFQ